MNTVIMNTFIGDVSHSYSQFSNSKSEDCFKERYSDEFIYPVKRGEPLNPSMFRKKIKDAFIESCMRTVEVNEEILKQPIALKSPMKKQLALISTQETKNLDDFNIGASYQKCFRDKYVNHQMFPQTITQTKPVQESFKHAQVSKCADGINFRCRNIEPALDSNLSANSSLSFHKESGSISRSRLKSWKSSSNGCPSKLIHFPKTTVETYLNDVIQLDNNNSNLSTMPLTLKNSLQKQNIPDLHLNFWGHSKYQPMRTNFSEEKPTDNMNCGTRTEGNVFFKYSVQNHENNPYIPQNFDQYNVSKSKDKLTKIMKTSFPKIQEKHSASVKNIDLVNFTIEDYERVQNTLKEARVCTSMLAQLLKKYEKANKEFNSVNKKKNKSNESPLNQIDISKRANTKDLKYSIYMDDEPRKEHSLKVTSKLLTEKTAEICEKANVNNYDHVSNEPDHSFIDEADNIVYENITTHGTCDDNNEGRDESGDDIIKKNDDLIKPITVEKEPIDKIIAKMLHKKYNKMRSRSIISSKRIKRFTDKSSVEISLPTETNNNAIKQNNRPFGQKTIIDKNIEEDVTEVNLPEIAQGVNLQKSTKESRVSKTEKNSIDSPILQKDVFMIKQPEVGDEFTWPVFKKTFCFDTELYSTDRRLSLLTPLEKNIKAVAETISTQLVGENAMYFYENKALVKLQFEVKKILDMPILQTYGSFMSDQKDKQDPRYNLSNTTFTQTNQGSENEQNMQKSDKMPAMELISSCEAMKVNFLNVRRVSEHTILVKWNYPRQLHNVRGYELLVDGRAVQKMFTSSRRMAVLTCISHSDRILLTVRTVPYSPCPDHSPAVTVIYRPKPKVKFI